MKKLLTIFAFTLMAFTTNAQTTIDGDMNHDGFLSIADVMLIISKILGNTPQSYLTCPDGNHPHLIDLGLPSGTKWACCNVGAYLPEASGDYFAWGEVEKKQQYSWTTYKHCDGSINSIHNIGSDIAGTQYDVAHNKWGEHWQMPTQQQMIELVQNCTCSIEEYGHKLIGPNGGWIFIPSAGIKVGSEWKDYNNGSLWSSTLDSSDDKYAYRLRIGSGNTEVSSNTAYRYRGFSVRPVWVQ